MKRLVSGNIRPKKAIELGVRSRWLQVREDGGGGKWIAIGHYAQNEKDLAESIKRLTDFVMSPYGEGLASKCEVANENEGEDLRSDRTRDTGDPVF